MNGNTKLEFGPPIELAREPGFALGAIFVRPSASEIVVGGAPRRVEPRVMQTLVALAQANGGAVSRDELMARCWSGMVVGEDAVTRAVGQVRRLTDFSPGAFAIETIPKIGYRLVRAQGTTTAEPALRDRGTAGAYRPRLAASMAFAAVVGLVAIAGAFAVGLSYSPALSSSETAEQRDALATTNAEARDRHLRATALLKAGGRDNALRAEQLLREALELDPSFHAAKEALVVALKYVASFVPERAAGADAEVADLLGGESVETPVVWRGHLMRGFEHGFAGEWLAAERALAKARATAPESAAGALRALESFILAAAGRSAESLELATLGARANPLSRDHSRGLQQWLDRTGRHAEAEAEYVRSRDLPGDRSGIELTALVRALGTGDTAKVAERLDRYRETDWGRSGDDALAALLDDRDAALAHLRRQIEGDRVNGAMPPFLAAAWASYYGDDSLAVEGLRAHPESLFANPGLIWDPVFAKTRGTPEFESFLRDFGYVEYWRTTDTWGDFCRPTVGDGFECR